MTGLIVFDLDGTLIDSRQDLADATNAMLIELGARPLDVDEITRMVGEGAAVLVRRALARAALDPQMPGALDRFLAQYDQRLTAHTRPYAGIPEALATLRAQGRTLAVLTNKPQGPTRRILEQLELDGFFSDALGGDTAAGRKPDPGGLLQVAKGAGADAASTVLVGDSPIDLETARRAGTGICLARYGFGYRFTEGAFRGDELFADTPADLPVVLSRLAGPDRPGRGAEEATRTGT
jgi:phosphoglycolate phosphatase